MNFLHVNKEGLSIHLSISCTSSVWYNCSALLILHCFSTAIQETWICFTVHFGPKKVVVLAGYKTVKEALVNYAEEFGNRDIMPIFHDFNKGHGKVINV